MSWPRRISILAFAFLWVLLPLAACFAPVVIVAGESEHCGRRAAESDAGKAQLRECCDALVRPDLAAFGEKYSHVFQFEVTGALDGWETTPPADAALFGLSIRNSHAPPGPSALSLVLRI